MKKLLTGAFVLLLATGAAQAQSGDKDHSRKHEKSTESLNLTEEQKTRLNTIRGEERTEMEALKKAGNMTMADRKAKRTALHEKYAAQRKAVLTPAQQTQWDAVQKNGRGRGAHRKTGGKMTKQDLNLSADQQAKMKGIREEFKTKAGVIKNNAALTGEQKKERFRELNTQQHEQMKSLLTKEQLERLKAARKDRSAK